MLRYTTYSNAIIAPYEPATTGVGRAGLVVNRTVVPESLVRRKRLAVGPVESPSFVTALSQPGSVDRVIYAGLAFSNFGHFLLEGLARLWICRLMPGVPLAWIGTDRHTAWQAEILELLGIQGPHLFVQSPERFKSVVLPQVGYQISDFFAREHRDFLAVVRATQTMKGKKAWISRSRLSDVGHVIGEEEIEQALMATGWEIFHPQEHKVIDQLRYFSSCEEIAGWEGSAFHSLILLRHLRAVVHVFPRGLKINDNYLTIANAKGYVQHVHKIPLSLVRGEKSKSVWSVESVGQVARILNESSRRSAIVRRFDRISRRIRAQLHRCAPG